MEKAITAIKPSVLSEHSIFHNPGTLNKNYLQYFVSMLAQSIISFISRGDLSQI